MPRIFPSPTLVLGLGRFGLATLERLADDWASLRASGGAADPSLRNLRLIWVRPEPGSQEVEWRQPEARAMVLARAMGEGDLPSLALDLVILRTLGLVRYRDGVYQVAVPQDAGVVEVEKEERGGKEESKPRDDEERWEREASRDGGVRRRRFFDWWSLSPDPIVAVERLRRLAERHQELDLFLAPILSRVRQGHSPRILLAVIGRCHALAQGRDPSPWTWLRRSALEGEAAGLPIPDPFLPRPEDPVAPFTPQRFLNVDWETTGWAAESDGHVHFGPVPASPFELGFFDSDAHGRTTEALESRLKILAQHLDRGLLRLWTDLQRERVEELDPNLQHRLRQEQLDSALRQSLEILGELLVRPLVERSRVVVASPQSRPEEALPGEPSPFLSSLLLDPMEAEQAGDALLERLAELGLASFEETRHRAVPLVRTVELNPRVEAAADGEAPVRSSGLLKLRNLLNEETRRVYDFSFLGRYRDRPTRRPPRMTVFVIGDMSEPFSRTCFRQVLREVHAELLRAFSPIFEVYREGADRCLTVTPILWMPHPADPFGSNETSPTPEENRCEEAAVIDAVHGIRRWVESVLPASRRRVSQIFVNGRVTDNAVLSLREAVRQTRDFLSFQMRNEMGRDPWLSRAAIGPGGDDLFSSFSCLEIDFPAERCREYLANKLARSCLEWIHRGAARPPAEPKLEGFEPPEEGKLVAEGRAALAQLTGEAAGKMEGEVLARATVERPTPFRQLEAAFDSGMERQLLRNIQERWGQLTRGRGRMDDLVDRLRRETATRLPAAVTLVQEHGDRLIQEQAGRGGLQAALAGFQLLRTATGGELQKREGERRRCEDLCLRHRIPDLGGVRAARAAVAAAAARKPDLPPLKLGLTLVALLAWPLGAPLAQSAGYLLGLGTWFGWVLGRLAGPLGGALLWAAAAFLLYRHLDGRMRAVREAIAALAQEVRLLFHGRGEPPEKEGRASVRTFFESRLELTAALATRGYALRIYERAVADQGMAHRLVRSLEVQAHAMTQAAEDLGVRPAAESGTEGAGRDDLRNLFATQAGEDVERLIRPDRLEDLFRERMGGEEGLGEVAPDLIEAGGGFGDWRRSACLSDQERILRFCRSRFDAVVSTPVGEQAVFAEEAGERLCRFVARAYPNMGFGAKFVGYEGLDPDGITIPACASLVLAPGLAPVFEAARRRPGAPITTETLEVTEAQVRANSAYMLSLVQGIRAHSVRNLRRFESFHDRVHMPDDRTFPLAQEEEHGAPAIINHLSGHRELGERLRDLLEGRP